MNTLSTLIILAAIGTPEDSLKTIDSATVANKSAEIAEKAANIQDAAASSDPDIAALLAIIALVVALIAVIIAVYLLLANKNQKSKGPSMEATKALALAQDLDDVFDQRCTRIASKLIKNELSSLSRAIRIQEEKKPEVKVEEKPVKSVFTSEILYGEYSDSDNGFFVEDMRKDKGARSQVVIETTSIDTADFSILPDVDKTLVSRLKECCKAEKGDWMEFNSIKTVRKGTIRLSGDIWYLVDKVTVELE